MGISWIIAKRPYETSAVMVILIAIGFVYSIVCKVKEWLAKRKELEERKELYRGVRDLRVKVQTIENNQQTILGILTNLHPNTLTCTVGTQTTDQ